MVIKGLREGKVFPSEEVSRSQVMGLYMYIAIILQMQKRKFPMAVIE